MARLAPAQVHHGNGTEDVVRQRLEALPRGGHATSISPLATDGPSAAPVAPHSPYRQEAAASASAETAATATGPGSPPGTTPPVELAADSSASLPAASPRAKRARTSAPGTPKAGAETVDGWSEEGRPQTTPRQEAMMSNDEMSVEPHVTAAPPAASPPRHRAHGIRLSIEEGVVRARIGRVSPLKATAASQASAEGPSKLTPPAVASPHGLSSNERPTSARAATVAASARAATASAGASSVFFCSSHLYEHFEDNPDYDFFPGRGGPEPPKASASAGGASGAAGDSSGSSAVMNLPIEPLWAVRESRRASLGGAPQAPRGRHAFRAAVSDNLLPRLREFAPDLLLISAGFDGAAGDDGNAQDDVGGLDLTDNDYIWVTKKLCAAVGNRCPVVSVLEGGYGCWDSSLGGFNRESLVSGCQAHVSTLAAHTRGKVRADVHLKEREKM